MSQTAIEEPTVGTPRDQSWPAGYTATLHTTVTLPHGFYPIISAYPSMADALAAAAKDSGAVLTWHDVGRNPDGCRIFVSDRVPYKSGTVSYTIWDWSRDHG